MQAQMQLNNVRGREVPVQAHSKLDPLLDRCRYLTGDKAVSQRLHGPISLPPVYVKVSHAEDSCINSILSFQVMRWPLC